MTAFILGAGLGTRLRPLTAHRPKPLIPVGGRPLITRAFDHLLGIGVDRLVVNTHWCAEQYEHFFPDHTYRSIPLTFVHESPVVLETAGGIWNARQFLEKGPFIVYNGDILSDLPLDRALAFHREQKNEVTLILRSDGPNRNVALDSTTGKVLDLRRVLQPDLIPQHSFTGIYFVEPQFIERITPGQVQSVVPVFHEMIQQNARLGGVVCDEGTWQDLGTREEYLSANAPFSDANGNFIDSRAEVGEGTVMRDCILWENASVAPGSKLTGCIVTNGGKAEGEYEGRDFVAPAAGCAD